MAHTVNTSVAAVKMSGSFAASFSSSEEEGEEEENIVRRSRSNAILESRVGLTVTHKSPCVKTRTAPTSQKDGETLSSSEQKMLRSATNSCATSLSSSSCATASSETETGSPEQRIDTDDPHSSWTSSTLVSDNKTLSSSKLGRDEDATLTGQIDRDSADATFNPNQVNSSISNGGSHTSSLEILSSRSSSSPVMVNRNSAHGATSSNGALSSANASGTSSGSSLREVYHQSRFNPFDCDIHLEEDHFSNDPDNNVFGRSSSSPWNALSSNSQTSDQWTERSLAPEDRDTVTFAELGLAEDHFSHPEGHFGLSRTEELEMAIDNCKDLIHKAIPDSERQKNLVRKLVQLRLKLQEMKDETEVKEENVMVVLGHRFRRKESRSSKYYCEKCNSIIWGLVQEWWRCLDCGFRCHDKCVSLITRNCAMVKVKENPSYILEICPRHPKGLAAQDYRCAECKAQIAVADGVEPRLCEYNGRYYCELCHWNDLMYIPAQILHNWDFEKRKVCRASKQVLKLMVKKAVISVQNINPMLFSYVEQLSDIKNLREELLLMKKYILACPMAMQAKLLLQLSSRPHFVECSDRYSLQDLLDSDDVLIPALVQVHSSWAQHIKTDCELCQGRGFLCELCTNKEVLFPFDNIAVVCSGCSAVMHRICFAQQVMCPKCERRRKRQDRAGASNT